MASSVSGVFSEDLQKLVVESKVLVVGAGGIGCEILKNLVMSGFNDIEIIDLDTIDVSNLNRQFLFHKEHVGKSKAEVARESALNFNPDAKIKAYHDSITSTEYGVNFYKRFSLVMNALDNRAARNHVNRMCLAAKLPLIESGTQGYNGQVELIKRGLSQCYECQPKAAQKTFPGCTIRNTPSEPIHCIVWAKHLFNQLFGEYDDDEEVSPDTADPEAAGEAGAKAAAEESNDKGNVERVSTRAWAEECKYDPEKLFNKFFRDDITYLLSMHNLWKERQAPKPLVWIDEQNLLVEEPAQTGGGLNSQRLWSMNECQRVFMRSVKELSASLHLKPEGDSLVWDKDDEFAMDFVAACANIRAQIFGIELKTRFDIKSMAGNIIPAIATANAIVAGIVVLRAFRVLQDELEKCQSVYLRLNPNPNNHVIVPERALNQPNPNCYVCSPQPEVTLLVDTTRMTVKELEEQVLKKSLNMVAPDAILDSRQLVLISSEEGETEALNDKKLDELGVSDGSILKVDDFLQNYALTVIINHRNISKEAPDFEVVYDATALKLKEEAKLAEPTPVASTSNGSGPSKRPRIDDATEVDDDDDLEVIEDEPEQDEVSVKRKNDNDDEEFLHKKGKTAPDVANINPIDTIDDDVMEIVSETEYEKKEEVCHKRKSDGVLVKDQPKSDDVSQNHKKSTNEKDISSSDTAQANSISTAPDVANINPIDTIDDDVMEIVSETESEKKEEVCRKRKSDGVLVKDQPKSDDVSQNNKQSTNEKDISTLETNANSVQTSDDDIIEIVSETESEKREEICRKYKTDTNITSPEKSQNHKQSDNCRSALDGDEPKPVEPSDNDIVEVMSETESEKTEEICRKRKTDVEDSSCKKRKTSENKDDIVTLNNPDADTV